jgi:hypothetical protein
MGGQRQPPANQSHAQPQQQSQAARPAGGITGYEAIKAQNARQTQIERQRQQDRQDGYTPNRFYLPDPTKAGITAEELEANIVILDHEPSFAAFEHQFPNPQTGKFGKGSFNQLCLSQEGHCPACDKDTHEPYFALFLSIIDMRGYTNAHGVFIPHSKKLLVIKNKNQDYFYRQYDRRGTLRGMQLLMVRNDKRGAGHGIPEFVDLHPEELIIESFAHQRVMSQDGQRVVKEENADCYAYDYAQVFPRPDYNAMCERFGVGPAAGSGSDMDSTWGADAGQFQQSQGRPGGIMGGRSAGGARGGIQSRSASSMPGHASDQAYDDGQADMDDDVPFDDAPVSHSAGRGNAAQAAGGSSIDSIPL